MPADTPPLFVLHYSPDSASMVVRMVLEELGLPHRLVLVDRAPEALQSPDYRALHPLGLIPAFETPDGVMFETAAILLWLADRHPEAGLAPAPAAPGRADFLKWLFFTSTNLHTALLQLYYPERIAGPGAVATLLPLARARVTAALAALDAAATARPGWLSPDKPSLMALYLGMLVRWLALLPDPLRVDPLATPALCAVLAAQERRPAVQRVAEDESLGPHPFTLAPPDRPL